MIAYNKELTMDWMKVILNCLESDWQCELVHYDRKFGKAMFSFSFTRDKWPSLSPADLLNPSCIISFELRVGSSSLKRVYFLPLSLKG